MHSKRKRISMLLAALAVMVLPAISQLNTYSPYTRFGLGDLEWGGFGQSVAMGGTGIAMQDADKLNYMNPAAYAGRDSMSVLFDFGVNLKGASFNTEQSNSLWSNANFNHIALSVPMTKYFAMGTGLVPYSNVGYKILEEYNDLGTGDPIDFYHQGNGGIMKYFLGVSGTLFERVSFGVNMNYLLGDINRERVLSFPRNRGFAETQSLSDISLSHTYFSFGMQYKEVFDDKFFFTLGATYDREAKLKSAITNSVTTYYPGSAGILNDTAGTVIDNEVVINDGASTGILTLPEKYGFGVAFGIPDKLTVTGDYSIQKWSLVDNSGLNEEGFSLADYKSMNAGIEYTPDKTAFRGYHNLMSFRAGGYYKESYVTIGGEQLSDYGITFGVGLPVSRSKSTLNVSFALGTRGTAENLIKENYGILTFNVTLHDLWFYKRKYD